MVVLLGYLAVIVLQNGDRFYLPLNRDHDIQLDVLHDLHSGKGLCFGVGFAELTPCGFRIEHENGICCGGVPVALSHCVTPFRWWLAVLLTTSILYIRM